MEIKSGNTALATYGYNKNGDMMSLTRNVPNTSTTYTCDALDRVKRVDHSLNGSHRTFDYDYDNIGNRLWSKRGPADHGLFYGDVFGYDPNDQVISVFLDVQFPESGAPDPGDQTIFYDWSGNRTRFEPYDWTETYAINDLNQYPLRNTIGRDSPAHPTPTPRPRGTPRPRPTPPGQQVAAYDLTGNMVTHFDGSPYVYDAQNRLTRATKGSATMTFAYDGLNRQVGRGQGDPMSLTFSVWDSWDLIEEYRAGNNVQARYLNGPNGVVKNLTSGNLYFQDGSGNASHLTDSSGNLREWYLYDLQGAPSFFDAAGNQRDPNQSAYGVRHLFTGQQWYEDVGLYDLRNRFYCPDIGRFLQPDPIDFEGDATNLYRYCGNNPVTRADPSGDMAYRVTGTFPNFNIQIPISYSGPGATPDVIARFNNGIGYYWSGTFGPYNVCTSVVPSLWGYTVTVYTGAGYMVVRGSSAGYWHAQGTGLPGHTPEFDAGHEVGHFFKLDDQYDVINDQIVPKMGHENDIMGGLPGTFPRADDMAAIIKGTQGTSTNWGHLPSGAPYVAFTQMPGFSGPEFTGFGGWVGGYGGYFGPNGGFNGVLPGPGGTPMFYGIAVTALSIEARNFGLWFASQGDHLVNIHDPTLALEWADRMLGDGSCFIAGTPVLMADGNEKAIESIQVGEQVLAWNEETKSAFPSKVVEALHHNEKLETLFDIELEDGRKFTVNNNHPMYVVEDGDFKFTDELAARFAKGEPVTFQDNNERAVKVANLRMRREICKMYNLHVEGQGRSGHNYYANRILVHNSRAGYKRK